jgi:Cof subfamily protein (haloacid dehalogenase superfamily)
VAAIQSLIACDLDGTLLDSQSRITEETIAGLRTALVPGVEFTICSGRAQSSVLRFVEQLGIVHVPVITESGAVIQDPFDWCVIAEWDVASSVVAGVLDFLQHSSYDFNFFLRRGGELVLYKNATAPFFLENTLNPGAALRGFRDIGAWQTRDIESYQSYRKIAIRCRLEETDALEQDLEQALGLAARVMKSDANCIDITGAGVDKGSAVSTLSSMLGVEIKNVMVLGDNETDASMFKVAGVSVAMANGDPQVIRMARYVAPSNNERGVVTAVQRFVSGEYHA